jgi:competence protein ComEA
MKTIIYIVIGVLVGLLVAGMVMLASVPPAGETITLLPAPTEVPLTVNITGAVTNPGVYLLARGSRVNDALEAAGGLLAEADTSNLNLAALVEDGQELHIPALIPGMEIGGTTLLININTATQAELENLPGIGPTLASNIIQYRQQYGSFTLIEDIKSVPGIGDAIFEQIKEKITTGAQTQTP